MASKSIAFQGLSVRLRLANGKVTQTGYHGPLVQLVETSVAVIAVIAATPQSPQ